MIDDILSDFRVQEICYKIRCLPLLLYENYALVLSKFITTNESPILT